MKTETHPSSRAPGDYVSFARLPASAREEVQRWRLALESVTPPVGLALARVAKDLGVSVQTARRKYDLWRKADHHWGALVNRAKCPLRDQADLHPETIEYFKTLCDRNQRKSKPAWRQ